MNDRYLYKGKIKGNLTGHEELDWAVGNLIVEQSTGRHFIVDLSHFDHGTKLCDVVIEVSPSTICQCTGFEDKNEKLIWENDIVKLPKCKNDVAVFMRTERSSYFLKGKTADYELGNCDSECFEVIGNIFDHTKPLGGGEVTKESEKRC